MQRVRRLPNAYPTLGGAIRRCHLRRFPYAILFAVADTEIVIIAVAHLRARLLARAVRLKDERRSLSVPYLPRFSPLRGVLTRFAPAG